VYWVHGLQNRPEIWFTPWRRTVGFPSFGFTHEDAFMPWKETRTVNQRLQFLSSYQREEMSATDLCHEYGILRLAGGEYGGSDPQSGRAHQPEEEETAHPA
jgi:hypothetical protein